MLQYRDRKFTEIFLLFALLTQLGSSIELSDYSKVAGTCFLESNEFYGVQIEYDENTEFSTDMDFLNPTGSSSNNVPVESQFAFE